VLARALCFGLGFVIFVSCKVAEEPLIHTPDECHEDDNVCDGNVANRCEAEGSTNAALVSEREDCGDDRICLFEDIDASTGKKRPVCVRKGPVPCGPLGTKECNGDRIASTCIRRYDGGQLVWRDVKCADDQICKTGDCVSR
jgi:hypothetical protein